MLEVASGIAGGLLASGAGALVLMVVVIGLRRAGFCQPRPPVRRLRRYPEPD